MTEEERENINNDEYDHDGYDPEPSTGGRRIHPAMIVAGVVAAVLLLMFAVWFFAIRDTSVGRPVPAPRSMPTDAPSGETLAGETITVTAEQREASGFVIETVGEQLAAEVGLTAATGVVEANAYRNTPALSLVGGVVRSVNAELGENVSAGETVAVVFSNEFAAAQSRYIALLTETQNARQNYERSLRLVNINQPGRTELDQAARQMKAAEAALVEMQNRYARTTRLVRIGAASREDLEQDTTKLRTAEAEVAEARNRHDRAARLLEINPETRAASEESLNRLRNAESETASVREQLILYGMPPARIASLRTASQITSELRVTAPISGTVTTRAVNAGEVIGANKEILRVTDLSTVWVMAQVYEQDLARLRVGSGASVTSNAFPDRLFRGNITYIDPTIDEATRTARVRVEIANPNRELRLGMFVNIAFGALGQSERTVPVVPAAAVQNIGGRQVVFRETADPNVFELRPVSLGTEADGRIPVIEGIQVGDRVVTTGSFMLRAEWLKLNPGN